MLTNLAHGLTSLGAPGDIGYLFAGALIGMIVGVIPGLGGAVVLSILLVFIYHIDLTGTLCLFLGAHAGSYYSASVTSILLNTPAHPEAFAVTFDGFPMAQKGQPGRALGISACSTCIGGFIGCAVLVGFYQIDNYLPGAFHPPEYVAVIALAMFLIGTLGTDSVAKALMAAGAGFLVASIGPSAAYPVYRYTFGAVNFGSGVSLVALALGVFAIPQMVMVFGTGTNVTRQDMTGKEIGPADTITLAKGSSRELIGGVFETFRHWVVLLQGALTGALTGIIPGVGGFAANFLSYGIAQQTSKRRKLFGTGIPEGIIAPEGASLSKEAGSMIPVLGLGIPGSVGGALFLAALSIKTLHVGYGFVTSYPIVSYQIVWIIALSGLIGTVAGVLIGPQLAKVTRIPGPLIVPIIFALSIVGPFVANIAFFSVMEVVVFGFVGLALRRLRYPLGSFILGLVLGPTLEQNIYLTSNIYGWSFFKERPFADVLFLIALGVLLQKVRQIRRESREGRAELQLELDHVTDETERAKIISERERRKAPYPLLGVITSVGLLAISLFFMIYGATHYTRTTATFPFVGGLLVALPALFLVPKELQRYVAYRKLKFVTDRALAATTVSSMSAGGQVTDGSFVLDKSWAHNGQYRREMLAFAWLFVLVALCWVFGFVWGVPTFVAAYGLFTVRRYFQQRIHHLAFVVLATAAMWGVTYEIFDLTHLVFIPKISL